MSAAPPTPAPAAASAARHLLARRWCRPRSSSRPASFSIATSPSHLSVARAKDQHDGAQPCGNSVAARNFVRLYQKTKEERYLKLSEQTIKALVAPLKESPTSLACLAEALGMYLDAVEEKK